MFSICSVISGVFLIAGLWKRQRGGLWRAVSRLRIVTGEGQGCSWLCCVSTKHAVAGGLSGLRSITCGSVPLLFCAVSLYTFKMERKGNGILSKLFILLVEIKKFLQHPFLAVFLVLDKNGSYKGTLVICLGWAKVPWLWLVQDQSLHREQGQCKSSKCTGKHRMQTLQNQWCFLLDSAFVFNLVLSSTCLHWYRPSLEKPIHDFQTANTFHQGS